MNRVVRTIAAATTLVFVCAATVAAEDPPDNIEYDIVRYHDSLTVWLNLSRYFNDDEFQHLADGIDYAISCRIELKRPRKLFGAEKLAETSATFRLTHLLATREFSLSKPDGDSLQNRAVFLSREETAEFLDDSILIPVAEMTSLKTGQHYEIGIDIARIALTSLNLATDDEGSDKSESPVKYLFRQFLHLTGYGREEYSTVSRSFALREIYPIR